MKLETSNFPAFTNELTTKLTRRQRLQLRNEIMLARLTAGEATKEQLREEFDLSERRINAIIQEARKELQEWFDDLPKNGMIAIFRANMLAVYKEIKNIENLRTGAKTLEENLNISKALINARMQLNRLTAEGPTYQKIKQLVES